MNGASKDPIDVLENAARDAVTSALGRVPESLRAGVTCQRAEQGARDALRSLTNQIRLIQFLGAQPKPESKS